MPTFIGTLLLGAAILGLVLWLRSSKINLRWYEWLCGALGFLLVIGAVQHYFGSLTEGYSTAGLFGALILGVPALILLAVTWQLVIRHKKTA